MSLIEDLKRIDVSGIVDARGSLSASISGPQISGIVNGGAASNVLGGLGSSIDALRADIPDGAALLQPLAKAIEGLAGHFDAGHLPIAELGKGIEQGLDFITALTGSITGDPSDFGKIFGTPLGSAMKLVGDHAGQAGQLLGAGADAFSALADGELPREPKAVVALLAEVLLPLPHATLSGGRAALDGLLHATAAIRLPEGRLAGLVSALDAVGEARTDAAFDAALVAIDRARANTIAVLNDDLQFLATQAAKLRPAELLAPLARAGAELQLGREGVIEFFDGFRHSLDDLRAMLANLDYPGLRDRIDKLAPMLEQQARAILEDPVDRAVIEAKDFVRRKLRELPVRALRQEISDFLHGLAHRIEAAGLDGPARTAHETLTAIAAKIDPAGLTAAVKAALADVTAALHAALDGVIKALDTIVAGIDALAGEAKEVLGKVSDALATFQTLIDGIDSEIAALGIDTVRDQVVDHLHKLRETVSKLLSSVPLPEPLKAQVGQLARLIEGIDLDDMFKPVREAAAALQIPDLLAADIHQGLAEAARVVNNLIPASLAKDISAETGKFLETVRGFDPVKLLPDVHGYLDGAAQLIEGLDPRPAAETIRGPFEAALAAFDKLHPARLLEPVTSGYDALVAKIPVPEARTVVTGLRSSFDAAGTVAARAIVEPAARSAGAAGGQSVTTPAGAADKPAPVAEPPDVTLDNVRAGDALRMLGAIPARARATLMQLEAGPAGDAMRALDGLAAGLARQARGLAGALKAAGDRLDADFDALLAALGPAQLRTQFALQARFSTDSAHFKASFEVVGKAAPAALRAELTAAFNPARAALHALLSGHGSLVADLNRLAAGLEATPLARLEGDLGGLLAALDPEPLAKDLDELVHDVLAMTPKLAAELLPTVRTFVERLKALINHFNPGAQAQKFLAVIDVVREEFELLDPHRLVTELAEVHGAIKATLTAYDPRALAADLAAITQNAAKSLHALDPKTLLGDLDFLGDITAKLAAADPGARLANVGSELADVGRRLEAVDLEGLIAAVNKLGPELVKDFEAMIEALKKEIVALLESLRYAGGSVSVSASVSVS